MSSQNNEVPRRGRGSGGRGTRGGRGSRGGRRGRPVSNPPATPPPSEPQPGPSREDPTDVLQVVRAQRRLTAKRVAGLTPAQRQELAARQQAAQLQRVLMPDAPPRKRSSKPSPPRQECEILPTVYAGKKRRSDGPSTSAAPPREEAIEVELLSTSRLEDLPVVILEEHMPPRVAEDEVGGELMVLDFNQQPPHSPPPHEEVDDFLMDAEAVAAGPSYRVADRRAINPNQPDFEVTVEEWIRDDLSDADMDDTDDDDTMTPMTVGRDATREPATDADLNAFEANVMRTEDRVNDAALRTIVPTEMTDNYTFDWTNDRHTFTGQRETFTGTQGPTFHLTDEMRPTDIFYKMFDTDFIDLLCTETNRYAAQKISALKSAGQLTKHSRMHRWFPTDRDEMITFLSVLILQGLYISTNEEAYFSFNGFGTMPYFSRIISYNRYLLLKMMLHFVDNDAVSNPSKLTKIQPVTDYLNKKFKDLYYPAQDIVIDESLLKWHGRLGFSQKISSKAAKVGIKTYELCESCTGYLWNFFVYSGKEKQTDRQRQTIDRPTTSDEGQVEDDDRQIDDIQDDDRQTDRLEQVPASATANIVNSLVGPLLNRGHTLIMDNFYNSPLLARYLKKNKTDCFGTLRLNREFVPGSLKTLKRTDLRHSEVVASYCSDLSVMVWRDANLVSMISTYHPLQIGAIDKHNRLKYKPNIVLEYNKSMGGVDKKDQVLSAQPIERKRNKVWYKKLFRRLYSTAIFNCYVLFRTAHPTMDHAVFRRLLAEDLLRKHRQIDITKEPRLFRPTTTTTRSILDGRPANNRPQLQHRHFPAKTGSKYTRCWWCTNMKKKNSRTSYKCIECNINLCVDDCFMQYHIH